MTGRIPLQLSPAATGRPASVTHAATPSSSSRPGTAATPPPPARVRTAGEIHGQPYHSTPGTKQGDVMLIAILEGRGYYEDEHGVMNVEKGMSGIIPDERPGILYADRSDPYHKAYCRFSGDYARFLAAEILGSRTERFFAHPGTSHLGERIRRMGYIHRNRLPHIMTADGVQLLDTLRVLQKAYRGIAEYGASTRITGEDIHLYLGENLTAATDLDRIAADLGVSRSTLCRTAKWETGYTVQQLHRHYKIEWAKRLLQSRRMNIAEVAFRSGYNDSYYFSKAFKKVTGLSPRAWRDATALY